MQRREQQRLAAERQRQIVKYVTEDGLTVTEAGRRIGVSRQRAWQLWRDANEKHATEGLDEWRSKECGFADTMIDELLAKAHDPQTPVREQAAIYREIRGFAEHRSKLRGVYAPVKKEINVLSTDMVMNAIQKAEDDLARATRTAVDYEILKEIT
jgi:hypothetical protein